MIAVVNQIQNEYQLNPIWKLEEKTYFHDCYIYEIKNPICRGYSENPELTLEILVPPLSSHILFTEKPKRNLSSLRGKLSKQSNKEIDDQLLILRNEWNRNTY